MRRMFSTAMVVLVLANTLMAAAPMLHGAPPVKEAHEHGAHDCCPKPVVQVRECCPMTIASPHPGHAAGACCCAESSTPGLLTRKTVINTGAAISLATTLHHVAAVADTTSARPADVPPDNSPPVLVLRN